MVRHWCDQHTTHVRARTFARAPELHRPCWVMVLLDMGLNFLATGVIVGVVGARQARVQVAQLERLRPHSAATFAE